MSGQWIFGHHAVTRALEAGGRQVFEVRAVAKAAADIAPLAKSRGVSVAVVDRAMLDKMSKQPHQGLAARVGPLPRVTLDSLEDANLVLALDQVTDPHNIGACMRSANALGVAAVLVPSHNSGHSGPAASKAAAGALEDTPMIDVGNLNQAFEKLKKMGFWIVGLDGHATQELSTIDLKGKIAIVMGSEGEGLRPLVAKNCDFLAKLPMVGTVESLNVSVATGIALYEVLRQRQG